MRKYHFEHPKISAKMVADVFLNEVVPWCKEEGIKLVIMDNDSKFHTKMIVTFMKDHGIQVYPGSGKKPWVTKLFLNQFSRILRIAR